MTVSKVVWTEDTDNKAWGAKENKREKRGLTREKGMEERDLRLKTRRLRSGDRVVEDGEDEVLDADWRRSA